VKHEELLVDAFAQGDDLGLGEQRGGEGKMAFCLCSTLLQLGKEVVALRHVGQCSRRKRIMSSHASLRKAYTVCFLKRAHI
jgi:hypothetical protein